MQMGSCLILRCRLSEVRDWKVLLLEAGGEEPNLADIPAFQPFTEQSRLNWYYESVPDSRFCGGKSCAFTTGKGLGGGSLHNEMLYSRGNSRIFNMWEDIGVFCTVTHSSFFTYPSHSFSSPSLISTCPLLLCILPAYNFGKATTTTTTTYCTTTAIILTHIPPSLIIIFFIFSI